MTKGTKAQQARAAENGRYDLASEDAEQLKHYYHQMLLLRVFEERTSEMYTKAKIGGYCHLNLGEEATIVGLMAALTPDDYIFTNYREHGYIELNVGEPTLKRLRWARLESSKSKMHSPHGSGRRRQPSPDALPPENGQ